MRKIFFSFKIFSHGKEIFISELTVLLLQAVQLDLVGFVLGLLLEPAGTGGKLVLLFSGFGSAIKGNTSLLIVMRAFYFKFLIGKV